MCVAVDEPFILRSLVSESGLIRFSTGGLKSTRATVTVAEHLPNESAFWIPIKLPKIYGCDGHVEDQSSADNDHEADGEGY